MVQNFQVAHFLFFWLEIRELYYRGFCAPSMATAIWLAPILCKLELPGALADWWKIEAGGVAVC